MKCPGKNGLIKRWVILTGGLLIDVNVTVLCHLGTFDVQKNSFALFFEVIVKVDLNMYEKIKRGGKFKEMLDSG